MCAASFEQAKQDGDAAFQKQAFHEAERCYAEALKVRPDAVVFCNRAFARIKLEHWQAAEEDATAALQFQLDEKPLGHNQVPLVRQ